LSYERGIWGFEQFFRVVGVLRRLISKKKFNIKPFTLTLEKSSRLWRFDKYQKKTEGIIIAPIHALLLSLTLYHPEAYRHS